MSGFTQNLLRQNKNHVNAGKSNFSMSDFIRFKNVFKSFESAAGSFEALKNIDLSIRQGEHIAVVGKSGSGKSTFLNMLTGIDHPTNGTVHINSTDIHALSESQLARWRGKNIGIVFQFFQLVPTLTINENLLLAMDFNNVIPTRERKSRSESLLEKVDISQHADKFPSELSGGEQQRGAIARALVNDPPIVVADEPTGNLDSKTTKDIQHLFAQLVKEGKTVIVVTHEDILVSDYDRVITLNDGLVAGQQKAEQMKSEVFK